MRRIVMAALLGAAMAVSFATSVRSGEGADMARQAALVFGRALVSGQASELRPILPRQGKVRVALSRMGPEEGFFGAGQVEALFRDFLAVGSVKSFDVLRLESDDASASLVHGRAVLTDRDGRPARVGLHLSFQPEQGRWVVREIKESVE